MKYKVLIFDADDTLFDFKASEREALEKTLIGYDIDYSEDYHLKIYKDINGKIWKELEEGKITQSELKVERFRRYCGHLNLDLNPVEFAYKYMENLSNSSILFEDSIDLISHLHEKFKLFIITNGLTKVQSGEIKSKYEISNLKELLNYL
ncbi:HAD family hydrolase [Candidatus Cetobacterium colombiensis]|uniref:HAD hydrolase-like protein n=1 Tax=Candidatus Cetobacterium colombiensis TaxID=3073100 RepID=A0ABU4W8X5_9FUSO|nr:HAD family hydrolase [Candidatus Cetobacterium colombiensis]MDX8335981.1 HAD hydrolase-like protein [Candidatus Cetobacterium colombiensis]